MKKSFLLIAILAAVLIFPFAINVDKAGADEIMFPWIVKADGEISTLVSVVHTAGTLTFEPGFFSEQLHYAYYWKNITGDDEVDQLAPCEDQDFKRPTTKDDIVTFDAAGWLNDGQPLFGDNTNGYGGMDFGLSGTGDKRAYLIVDNNTPFFVDRNINLEGTLYGEALVLEISGGAAWGYIAFNGSASSPTVTPDTQHAEVSFDDGTDLQGEVIGDREETQLVLLPADTVATKMFVTPVDDEMRQPATAGRSITTEVHLCIAPDQNGDCNAEGFFDNDENPISTDSTKRVVCTSADDISHYLSSDDYDDWVASGGQLWTYLVTERPSLTDEEEVFLDDEGKAIIAKLEYNLGSAEIDGFAIPGTFNNFVWLRDNESRVGQSGINYIHNVTCDDDPGGCLLVGP
jgi:hypothetical protein